MLCASSRPVRVLLQHCHRLTYYKAPQEWTTNPDEALTFDDPASALAYFRDRAMADIQLVLRFNSMRTLRIQKAEPPQLLLKQDVADNPEARP